VLWHGHPFDYAPYFVQNDRTSQGKQDRLGRVFTSFRNKISNGVHGLEARATMTIGAGLAMTVGMVVRT